MNRMTAAAQETMTCPFCKTELEPGDPIVWEREWDGASWHIGWCCEPCDDEVPF